MSFPLSYPVCNLPGDACVAPSLLFAGYMDGVQWLPFPTLVDPMPPAPLGVSPDSPVDPPLPPRDKPGGGNPAVKRQGSPFPQVDSSPPAILTNPEAENDDE